MKDNEELKTPINRPGSNISLKSKDSTINYNKKSSYHTKPNKKKRRDKSDLGNNFVPPNGGWGWVVAIAGGVNILVTVVAAQQFGIIFRDHMILLGISNSQLTTIINTQIAVSAISGLLNGPLFRRFSYRQIALVGSIITFIGLFTCAFADSFIFYILSFSCLYGFGRGLTLSAASLAVNTYFKEKRRTATSYQFGVASLGSIICPHVANFLLGYYGVRGTVLFFAALSLNNIACALIYQPVKWHVKDPLNKVEASIKLSMMDLNEIISYPIEAETPVKPRASDCHYGSKTSLNITSIRNRLNSLENQKHEEEMMELLTTNNCKSKENKSNSLIYINENGHNHHNRNDQNLDKKEKEKPLIKKEQEKQESRTNIAWYMKIVVFFDLGLLRDITFVSLIMCLTVIGFVEINFGVLTPFILGDFGYPKHQITMAMSVLGFFDLVIRFLIPMITAKINLSNQTFFVLGVVSMCFGRIFLTLTTNFYVMIGIFAWLGLSKALRIVFTSLIIPGYVPLKRLPAAAGLQLLMAGIFALSAGPIVGLIRDRTNYAFTINVLNGISLFAVACWGLESMVRKYRNKPAT